jgi:hypothetical protein
MYDHGMSTRATVIDEELVREVDAEPSGDDLWVAAEASGWEAKPAGLCRGALCIPLPADRPLVRADGAVNLAGLARHRGQAVVRDDEGTAWVFGPPGEPFAATRASLEAPDFTLPDLEGRSHSLAAERGRKVLLASWASW